MDNLVVSCLLSNICQITGLQVSKMKRVNHHIFFVKVVIFYKTIII